MIALLAEEGDDLSKLESPREESSSSSKAAEPKKEETSQTVQPSQSSSAPSAHDIDIHHSRPLFPSVLRLLLENGIEDADRIKGTGVRGMLTKGDVLSFLGKASSPVGTYKEAKPEVQSPKKAEEPKVCELPSDKLKYSLKYRVIASQRPNHSSLDCFIASAEFFASEIYSTYVLFHF